MTEQCISCGKPVEGEWCPPPCSTDLRDSNNRVSPVVVIVYECSVCHKQTVSEPAATIGNDHCCSVCAEQANHPGKFQGYCCSDPKYFDRESMGKALLLYEFMSEGDDWMSNEGWGYCARIDNYLVMEDTQGFVSYEEFADAAAAEKKFDEWYMDGWGASEDDIYITCESFRGWEAWESGKQIPVWSNRNGETPRRRILAAISLHIRKTGCYPNIWEDTGRGTLRHIGKEVW